MFGSTLAARVARCWQLSLVPHPLDLSSCTFDARVLGTRLWTIRQPRSVGWRLYGIHLPSRWDLITVHLKAHFPDPVTAIFLRNQHLHLHQKHAVVRQVVTEFFLAWLEPQVDWLDPKQIVRTPHAD